MADGGREINVMNKERRVFCCGGDAKSLKGEDPVNDAAHEEDPQRPDTKISLRKASGQYWSPGGRSKGQI